MKLIIASVGHRMPAWVSSGFEDYARRMPREMPLKLVEVKPEHRQRTLSTAGTARLTAVESDRLLAGVPHDARRIVLDERGRQWGTRDLSRELAAWRMEGRDVAFLIGGADGLAEIVRQQADRLWALSALTLPHGLVRILVAEQLYRASSILMGHPYHRA